MQEIIKRTQWSDVLLNLFNREPILDEVCQRSDTLPPKDNIFKAFTFFEPKDLKVVIIGQDPYQNKNLANGLCFSVPLSGSTKVPLSGSTKVPPSLRNIFKELERCYGTYRNDTDLSDWATNGVLLLNTALTVKENEPGSHTRLWKNFTTDLIKYISQNTKHVVYMLWGNHAQSYQKFINENENLILEHTHPSPLSRKPFVGNDHFRLANEYLQQHNKEQIIWV